MPRLVENYRLRSLVAMFAIALLSAGGAALAADLAENPNLTTEGPGLDVAMAGVGLSNLENSGTETLSIFSGGTVEKAALYWVGGGTAGQDDALLVNGSLVTAMVTDVNTDPPAFDVVGYRTDVTALVQAECVTPGLCTLDIEDADLGNNFYSNLVGAGLLVIFTNPLDPNVNRIIVIDGVDWAFSRTGVPVAGPAVFNYDAASVDRPADLMLFTADGEPTRTDRIDISDNPSIFNEIVGNQGPFYDLFERSILVPANVSQTEVAVVSPPEPPTADSLIFQTAALRLRQGGIACRFTGGGVDTDLNWDHTLEDGSMCRGVGCLPEDIDRYQMGGQGGAPTALPPQPSGEWQHHQQTGPSGRFSFHGGTSSAIDGTEIAEIRCSDPGYCRQARPAPAKQLDMDGIGTFSNVGKGSNAPAFALPNANVVPEKNKKLGPTFHWFEVNVDDLGEPGRFGAGAPDSLTCPSSGFGEKGALPLADCDCPDYYRITIYDGVDAATLAISGPNKTDVIYEVFGYIDGGNLQIHPLTGNDSN
jgi:hypothetical protein